MRVSGGLMLLCISGCLFAASDLDKLNREIKVLKSQTAMMEKKLNRLQHQRTKHTLAESSKIPSVHSSLFSMKKAYHDAVITTHVPDKHPESLEFYPTALMVDGEVLTYIAGTPVVTSPYLGARPAFDGSDYIVNISSINRDIRLMQQRRNFYREFETLGYPHPDVPVITLSGKVEPLITAGRNYMNNTTANIDLGSNELDIAAILNENVEAYMGIAYDSYYPTNNVQRVLNSGFNLNMGFVNIGNLDKTPFYLTAGQIYVPFGRYSTSMVSATLPTLMMRTKARPFIIGYKSQEKTGPLVSLYGFTSETTLGRTGVGGVNLAYIFAVPTGSGEIGGGMISSIDESAGMQRNGSVPGTTFGGFGSITNGSESVSKVPGFNLHGNVSVGRYSLTAEWVAASRNFRPQDLSFYGHGSQPQAGQVEGAMTFTVFNKPASLAASYQWTREALALNLPKQRVNGVFNISIWKDTIESLEYRHDTDYPVLAYANGANAMSFPPNQTIFGTGGSGDTVLLQLGVFF